MCFETTKSAKAKIAKTDIECWKVVNPNLTNAFSKYLKFAFLAGPVQYEPGKVMLKVALKRVVSPLCDSEMRINKGYHSFIKKPILKEIKEWKVDSQKIITRKFIIPAGTRYYENETEYVSETIMLIK